MTEAEAQRKYIFRPLNESDLTYKQWLLHHKIAIVDSKSKK